METNLTTFTATCFLLLYFVSIQATTMGNSNNVNETRKLKHRKEAAHKKRITIAKATIDRNSVGIGHRKASRAQATEATNWFLATQM